MEFYVAKYNQSFVPVEFYVVAGVDFRNYWLTILNY